MLEEDCGWIGSTRSRETGWIAEERRRRESRAIALRGRGKEGKGRAWGSKQLGWISDLAQPRAFESDPKLDGWASCREGKSKSRPDFFFSPHAFGFLGWGPVCRILVFIFSISSFVKTDLTKTFVQQYLRQQIRPTTEASIHLRQSNTVFHKCSSIVDRIY